MMATSPSFTPIITVRLLQRSASQPPIVENNKNGTANSSDACEAKPSFWVSLKASDASTGKITSQRRALSENAPWNWVNIRFQKPFGQDGEVVGCMA